MKTLSTMTNEQVLNWVTKTANTMMSHTERGHPCSNVHSIRLAVIYDSLKKEALHRKLWTDYCKENDLPPKHDGMYNCS